MSRRLQRRPGRGVHRESGRLLSYRREQETLEYGPNFRGRQKKQLTRHDGNGCEQVQHCRK